MLLREFIIDNHTINLNQEGKVFVATIYGSGGERVFNHEYGDYEKIKLCFDEIIQSSEKGNISIADILKILEKSTM